LRVQAGKGPLSHQVIELAATGQLGMAAAGQIRLAVVKLERRVLPPFGHGRLIAAPTGAWVVVPAVVGAPMTQVNET
jgi:hypothetical protein